MASHSVSVVIPAYNAEPFIAAAVRSALGQSHPPLEVLVVDDGSTDATADIVRALGPAVTLVTQTHGGVSRARNHGARLAQGEWLAFLDADDEWLPAKLERQLAVADDGVALVHCDRYNIGDLDGLDAVQRVPADGFDGDGFVDLLLAGNQLTTSGVIVRRRVLLELGGFDDALKVAEDWDLWLRIADRYPIRACREPLVRYRLHAAGASRSCAAMNRARCVVVGRALTSPRGRRLGWQVRRRIWSATWATNGWDAARHGVKAASASAYLRAMVWWPFGIAAYLGLARIALGR